MTNRSLKAFKNALHHSLRAKEKNGYFCVGEQENTSSIKEINFKKENNDDVVIIQQDIKNCQVICNLFENKTRVPSCDFIVLLNKKQNLHIFFCEIKSSLKYKDEAIKQARSSKIFLEYLHKNYKEQFDGAFELSLENTKNIYIYPASISAKQLTYIKNNDILFLKKINVDPNGSAGPIETYKFFLISGAGTNGGKNF